MRVEYAVAITDFILFVEGMLFTLVIVREKVQYNAKVPFLLFFFNFALASLIGSLYHGYSDMFSADTRFFIWWLVLVLVGLSSYGFALVGGDLLIDEKWQAALNLLLLFVLFSYLICTIFYKSFLVAIMLYFPCTLLTLAGFARIYMKNKDNKRLRIGIYGLILSLLAPTIQHLKITIHPIYLPHNSLYHMLMMLAIYLLFIGVFSILDINESQAQMA